MYLQNEPGKRRYFTPTDSEAIYQPGDIVAIENWNLVKHREGLPIKRIVHDWHKVGGLNWYWVLDADLYEMWTQFERGQLIVSAYVHHQKVYDGMAQILESEQQRRDAELHNG